MDMGGTLARIGGSSENKFVGDLINDDIWIGLNDKAEAGKYVILHYTTLHYTTLHCRYYFSFQKKFKQIHFIFFKKKMRILQTILVPGRSDFLFFKFFFTVLHV